MRIALALVLAACSSSHRSVSPDAGAPDSGVPDSGMPDSGVPDSGVPDAGGPAALWSHTYDSNQFARALDVSCAPADAGPGMDGCIALVRYNGSVDAGPLDGGAFPASSHSYGNVIFLRTHPDGGIRWTEQLMSGFDPIAGQEGALYDEDLRVHLLANDEFLVNFSYTGRVFAGYLGDPKNQEFGPTQGSDLVTIEFHSDGHFDNWEEPGGKHDGREQRALSAVELPNTQLAIAGTCQGSVPLDTGSFNCPATSGYVLTVNYDCSTVGAVVLSATSYGSDTLAAATDLVTDAAGNVYAAGWFKGTLVVGGADQAAFSAGEEDAFLLKLKPDRTRDWVVTASGIGRELSGRVARVNGGVLWTSLVSVGAVVGTTRFPAGGRVIARVDDTGSVAWAHLVPAATGSAPLGVAAADDGSFALYGDSYLGLYAADGTLRWERTDGYVSGASFTRDQLVVAATATGTTVLGVPAAASNPSALRAAVIGFPTGSSLGR